MDWLRNFSRICLRKPQENLPLPLKDPKKRWKASEWEKREKRGAKKKCTEFFSWETSGYFGYVLQNDFVEKIGSTKRILKKCVVGNSAKTFLGWWVYLTRTQRLLKWPINKGTKLGHDLNNLSSHGFLGFTFDWFLFLRTHGSQWDFLPGAAKAKAKAKVRFWAVGRSQSEHVRATITSWGGTFEIYYLWIIWHMIKSHSALNSDIHIPVLKREGMKKSHTFPWLRSCQNTSRMQLNPQNWSLVPGNAANVTHLGGEFKWPPTIGDQAGLLWITC